MKAFSDAGAGSFEQVEVQQGVMMVVQLRVALLAGACASTLGLAVPANSATNVFKAIAHTDAIDPVEDTIGICALADTCDSGVESSGTGSVAETVNNPRHGDLSASGAAGSSQSR